MRLRLLLAPVLALAGLVAALGILAAGAQAAVPVHVRHGLVYERPGDGLGPLRLDAYLPRTRARRPAVIYVHGGGWTTGRRQWFGPHAPLFAPAGRWFAHRGMAAFSIDYRLAPAERFPAAVENVEAAVRWVRAHARRLHVDPRRIALLGGSAGANLAVLTALEGHGPNDRGDRVGAVVSWSGPMDLASFARQVPGFVSPYLGCRPEACPERADLASPDHHVDPSDPPVFLVNSTNELVPVVQADEMVAALRRAGVPHRLLLLRGSRHAGRYAHRALGPTLAFLRRVL